MQNVRNAWVRRTDLKHFCGGAILLLENTKHITIEDCCCLDPIFELGGYRRQSFYTLGQLNLFLRCWASEGLRDFSAGHCAAGPNAFVNCYADRAMGNSGPIESWASGVLYDNVRIDAAGLHLTNRQQESGGAGWSAANCVLWQCQAATMQCVKPPTANNWAIGIWASAVGNGVIQGRSEFVRPISHFRRNYGKGLAMWRLRGSSHFC